MGGIYGNRRRYRIAISYLGKYDVLQKDRMTQLAENVDIDAIADSIAALGGGYIKTAELIESKGRYLDYADDPVRFAKEVLGIELTEDVKAMLESVRDNRITVARSATGTGKSHGASVSACWFFKCFKDSRVYTTATPFENVTILWSELSSMIKKNKQVFTGDKITNFHIERNPKDFITSLTVPTVGTDAEKEGKFSGKHHKHMLFIVDEGDTAPDFAYKGIEGCMSGGIVRLLILFNPRYEAGRPYRLERDKEANVIHLSAFNHPNVISGEDVIPGAVNRETTVQRINKWCRPLAKDEEETSECFVLPEFLENATAVFEKGDGIYPPLKAGVYVVQEPAFHYMVRGEYPPQPARQLISREWVNKARSRYDVYVSQNGDIPPFGISPVIGGDIAEYGTDKNSCCRRYGGYVPPLKLWGGIDTISTAERFRDEYILWNASIAFIDATGVGSGVAPMMIKLGCSARSVKVSERPTEECELGEFAQLRDQLYWRCREWLKKDMAMLPPDEDLIQELLTPTYSVVNGRVKVMSKNPTTVHATTGSGKVCMRELLKRSPDRMEALIMTFFPDTPESEESHYGDLGEVFH